MLPWFAENRFPLYLAPMAGFTDVVFRALCKEHGADVMVTEFVLAEAFLRAQRDGQLWETVDFTEAQRPMGVQIFGADSSKMAEAGRVIADYLRPDFIDINFGCPSPRICAQAAGSSLLKDLPRLGEVAKAVVRALPDLPVTAKIRLGWDERSVVAREAAVRLEEVGVRAVAVHGRTKVQGYRGEADWVAIGEAAAAVSVPVVGNGSITSAEDLARYRRMAPVRGVMIGRAALGYPWVFRELKAGLRGEKVPPPGLRERWEVLLRYCRELQGRPARQGRWDTLAWMRPRLQAFTTQLRGGRQLRHALERVESYAQLEALAGEHLKRYGEVAEGAQQAALGV